jgi:hypothetical protein
MRRRKEPTALGAVYRKWRACGEDTMTSTFALWRQLRRAMTESGEADPPATWLDLDACAQRAESMLELGRDGFVPRKFRLL